MKKMYVIVLLILAWCLVALGCAIFKVPFHPYGIYWWIVSIVLIVLQYIEVVKAGKR